MIVIVFLAHLFSVLRLPFALTPYLIKLALIYCLGDSFSEYWKKYSVQVIRIFGDFMNFLIAGLFFYKTYESVDSCLSQLLLILVMAAEFVRLLTEKGTMILSALWQAIPHRLVARFFHARIQSRLLKNYCNYYILSDEKRLEKVLRRLKASVYLLNKTETISKLKYVNSFRIVPDSIDLRAGNVRNVAKGIVYVHARLTNNPDILRGQAFRRSPWIFDPRFLRRPFYYRTEANRLMTNFVFENLRLCPVYAIYQFGHEIKSARYEVFFRFFRWLGYELEETVRADGTYNFDPFAKSIFRHLSTTIKTSYPLWTDDEVITDMAGKAVPSALEIAEKYTYPLIYVQDVLLPSILAYRNVR